MVTITDDFLEKSVEFNKAGIVLPKFDIIKMRDCSYKTPQWVHFGGGNLYRCFHSKIAQDLLNKGLSSTGIIVVDTFDQNLIEKAFNANNNRSLSVVMKANGTINKELLCSTAEAYYLNGSQKEAWNRMVDVFSAKSLEMVTISITEKGYAVKDMNNNLLNTVVDDINTGIDPYNLKTTMAKLAFLLYNRYKIGAYPIALISTDNFSHNSERLKTNLLEIIKAWQQKGFVEKGFLEYIKSKQVSFCLSMIDRITPFPSSLIAKELKAQGIDGMEIEQSANFANFVNTEETSYLVIEDSFPNNRLPLEKVGIYLTNRDTVNKVDLMKVCSCLNPLHTALAVFGCLLNYNKISSEMADDDLRLLVEKIGYKEGLPVVVDPKIIDPKKFIKEVINTRFVNTNIPDTPQRIATDTSQKVGIRFGETIKKYFNLPEHSTNELVFIPLTLAAWLRYLIGKDDFGNDIILSPDPLLNELKSKLDGLYLGYKGKVHSQLKEILNNELIFGIDLYKAELGIKIESYFQEMISDVNMVRTVLQRELKK